MTLHTSAPLATQSNPTVMETIMKPLSFARRGARWLVAAGIALAAMPLSPAAAQPLPEVVPELRLDHAVPHPGHDDVVPFFTKKGVQRNCDYVIYNLRFGARGNPEKFFDPAFANGLKALRMDFRDQVAAGLTIVNVQASGDGTDAVGGPLPAATIGTTTNPNDTATISDFRLSATDLDGVGVPNERYIDIRITALIDHAAFPAPAVVDNQGFVKLSAGPGSIEIPSHDPSKPDDGDFRTGEKTSIRIDVTDCEPPRPRLLAVTGRASKSNAAMSIVCPAAAPTSTTCLSDPRWPAAGCSFAPPRPASPSIRRCSSFRLVAACCTGRSKVPAQVMSCI